MTPTGHTTAARTLRRRLATLAAALGLAAAATAQIPMLSDQPYFEVFNANLTDRRCNAVIEDSDGYIWVGTQEGVARFDGIYMQCISNPLDSLRSSERGVVSLCEDRRNNRIWLGTAGGFLAYVDLAEYVVRRFDFEYDIVPEVSSSLRGIYCYGDSDLIINLMSCGVYRVNLATRRATRLFGNVDDDRRIQVANTGSGRFEYVIYGGQPYRATLDDNRLTMRLVDAQGRLRQVQSLHCPSDTLMVCVSIGNIVSFYNRRTDTVRTPFVANSRVTSMTSGPDGIWFGTNRDGLFFYDYRTQAIKNYNTHNSGLSSNSISSLMRSRNQPIVWATCRDGLVKNDYYNSKFLLTDFCRTSNSRDGNIYMVFKDMRQTYWVWCIDGLFRRRAGESRFEQLHTSKYGDVQYNFLSALEDSIGHHVFFCGPAGLVAYSTRTETFTRIHSGSGRNSFCLIDGGRTLLYLSGNKFHFIDVRTCRQTDEYPIPLDYKLLTLSCENDTTVWMGSFSGEFYSFNLRTRQLSEKITVPHEPGTKPTRIGKIIPLRRSGIRELWITTYRGELYYYLPDHNKMVRIEGSRYLENISSMEADMMNNIWLSTAYGVVCINNQDGQIYEYSNSQYALCREFNYNTSSITPEGNILMGGVGNFVEFRTDNFEVNQYFPAPIISSYRYVNTQVSIYDDLVNKELFLENDTLLVPCGVRSTQVFVRTLNMSEPLNNLVEWRIDGGEWKRSRTSSSFLLSDIGMGMHRLDMRPCNRNLIPIPENTRTVFVLKEIYFYEHPAFNIIIILVILNTITWLYIRRTRMLFFQKVKLEKEVQAKAGRIIEINAQLTRSRDMIAAQNIELQQSKVELENKVTQRTIELNEALRRAESSNKLKTNFLARLSHEIRTPMNCIVGFAKLLNDPSSTEGDRKEFVHLILESSQTLLSLIGDLLDCSRIETGQIVLNLSTFDIASDLRDLYQMMLCERKDTTVQLLLDVDPNVEGRSIYTDRTKFKQLIINLTYNALKFTEKGYVKIHAKVVAMGSLAADYGYPRPVTDPAMEVLLVAVEDTGYGIPADKLEEIFDAFIKLKTPRSNTRPGFGIGLSIVNNYSRKLNGDVWVQSTVGAGSTFFFYLPL